MRFGGVSTRYLDSNDTPVLRHNQDSQAEADHRGESMVAVCRHMAAARGGKNAANLSTLADAIDMFDDIDVETLQDNVNM